MSNKCRQEGRGGWRGNIIFCSGLYGRTSPNNLFIDAVLSTWIAPNLTLSSFRLRDEGTKLTEAPRNSRRDARNRELLYCLHKGAIR